MRATIRHLPLLGPLVRSCYRRLGFRERPFPGSAAYWIDRYASGGNSGAGSYRHFAQFKAEILNSFVADQDISTVMEFGCGDGNQLKLAEYPRYVGFDVSPHCIAQCSDMFADDASKSFKQMSDYGGETAELVLSLDVIYHLVEDEVFETYMRTLFAASDRFVIIYSSDEDAGPEGPATHVRHRKFSRWIETHAPEWTLSRHIPNRYPYKGDETGSFADFFIYQKTARSD